MPGLSTDSSLTIQVLSSSRSLSGSQLTAVLTPSAVTAVTANECNEVLLTSDITMLGLSAAAAAELIFPAVLKAV